MTEPEYLGADEPVGLNDPDPEREAAPPLSKDEEARELLALICEGCYRQGVVDGANAAMANAKLGEAIRTPDAMWQDAAIREASAAKVAEIIEALDLIAAPAAASETAEAINSDLLACIHMLMPGAAMVPGLDIGFLNDALCRAKSRCRAH